MMYFIPKLCIQNNISKLLNMKMSVFLNIQNNIPNTKMSVFFYIQIQYLNIE